jgi:glycine/D-amino acid oxidase-like deaminating enzyme
MPDQPAIARADVVIAGGGFAGLALALALRQKPRRDIQGRGRRSGLRGDARADLRASAIAAAARRMFETLGVWDAVAADAQPILDMVVTDSKLKDAVRPVFLTSRARSKLGEPFAPHDRERSAQCGARRKGARRGNRDCARRRSRGSSIRADASRCRSATAERFRIAARRG